MKVALGFLQPNKFLSKTISPEGTSFPHLFKRVACQMDFSPSISSGVFSFSTLEKPSNLSPNIYLNYSFLSDIFKNSVKRGCGSSGRDLNSGWNWVPRKKGWTLRESSAISISTPSGDLPEKTKPAASNLAMYSGFTS